MVLFIVISVSVLLILFAWALKPLWRNHRGMAISALLFMTLLTAGLYLQLGKPAAIDYKAPVAAAVTMEQAMQELNALVKAQPGNIEARVLLARSYMQIGKPIDAQPHYAAALKLQPDNVNLMVDYAEALFRSGPPNTPDPRAQNWIDKALALDPANQRARFFQGILLLQAGKPGEAAKAWESLLPQVDASTAAALLPQINRARADAGLAAIALPASRSVSITVDLDPAFKAGKPPGSVLFVFARSADGLGPPVAAKRVPVSAFPMQLQLSDADSIMPTATLFSQRTFTVHARISATGSAEAKPGDWEAAPATLQSDKLQPVTLQLRPKP
jgi:cytochrome c-type biogenesis protein CcmH